MKRDHAERSAVSDEVTAQIRRAINDGEAKPGERLPPARDLAAELGVDTDAVVHSLHLLCDEGLLENHGWSGVRMPGTSERVALVVKARRLVTPARRRPRR